MDHRIITRWLLLLLLLPGAGVTLGQTRHRVLFYNVENLFDTRDDPMTQDEEFTPTGNRYWTRARYSRKLQQLSRTLVAAGSGTLPLFIGLAEVENRQVLLDLTTKTALAEGDYGVVHADSPDARGIDVALLYRQEFFHVLTEAFLPVHLEPTSTTRDILYCKGILQQVDTFHLFVCHFPSMVGGERRSEWKRVLAAGVVRRKVDSIQQANQEAAIIVMGDLNGRFNTKAQRTMRVKAPDNRPIQAGELYNTSYHLRRATRGSYRYKGKWQTIDHIIVSGTLLNGEHTWQVNRRMEVFMADFLLEEDKNYYGKKPFPTYRGPRYMGGYSDHLPVYVDLSRPF